MMAASNRASHEIETILRNLGFDKIKRKKDGFTALCRFHDEKDPSFSIGDNGLWMCWSGACGAKGNLKQLHERLGVTDTNDWRFSLQMSAASLNGRKQDKPRGRRHINLPEDFTEYSMLEEVPEVIRRRLKWETIKNFHLGSCHKPGMNAGRCIIPVYHKGNAVGYHGRALRDDLEPRYYNPAGFEIKEYLFNYDGCQKGSEVFVVEGAFNAMSMWEKGFTKTVATFGTKFVAEQIQKIFSLSPSEVVICFDRDPSKMKDGKEVGHAGQKAAIKLGDILSDLLKVWVMPLPFEKDPNNLPVDTLQLCYSKRVPFDVIKR